MSRWRQMLRVFDAEAAVARAVLFFRQFVHVEDRRVRLVADGVYGHLQTGAVGGENVIAHLRFRNHFGVGEAAGVRGVEIRMEEKRGGGAEGAIGESF